MRATGDRGAATVFIAVLAAGLFVLLGLIVDGGRILRSARDARSIAAEAARAGAQAQVNVAGVASLDPVAATQAAESFLAANGASGSAAVACGAVCDRVTVTVNDHVDMRMLVFISDRSVSATATVRLSSGRIVEGG